MRVASAIVVLAVFVCAAPVAAQTDGGQIRGVLSGARGPIPNAEVRIKNTATEQVTVTTTSQAGEFSATVPAGTYDVFSSTVGYAVLARRGVTVKAGATERVDAKLGRQRERGHAQARFSSSTSAPRRSRPPARRRGPGMASLI